MPIGQHRYRAHNSYGETVYSSYYLPELRDEIKKISSTAPDLWKIIDTKTGEDLVHFRRGNIVWEQPRYTRSSRSS